MPSEFNQTNDRDPSDAQHAFAPRVFEQPDSPQDLAVPDEWPADLEALAEQLVADASFLAERYPASARHVQPSQLLAAAPHRHSVVWPRRVAVAAALCLVGSLSIVYWSRPKATQLWTPVHIMQSPVQMMPTPVATVEQSSLPSAEVPAFRPTFGFQDLTPPEQEAVLDLLEDADEPMRLSI